MYKICVPSKIKLFLWHIKNTIVLKKIIGTKLISKIDRLTSKEVINDIS